MLFIFLVITQYYFKQHSISLTFTEVWHIFELWLTVVHQKTGDVSTNSDGENKSCTDPERS